MPLTQPNDPRPPEIVLADALDQFFYDLPFTAPEAWHERIGQLGNRIRETMVELGYPKKGKGL